MKTQIESSMMKDGLYKRKGIKMNTFFGSTFIKQEVLEEARIDYPIKLEYYKMKEGEKFGIEIVKKEYRKEGTQIDNEQKENVSKDEKEIERILKTLEQNEVTPMGLEEILNDLSI